MPQGRIAFAARRWSHARLRRGGAPITAKVRINNDEEFFKRCAYYGNVGMGEAYTEGFWDTDDIKAVVTWFVDNMAAFQGDQSNSSRLPKVNLLKMVNWMRHLKRSNTIETSRLNISEHYDLGNQFYQEWLDGTMSYSCAMFDKTDESFEAAQNAKYEALCRKLQLQKGRARIGNRLWLGRILCLCSR